MADDRDRQLRPAEAEIVLRRAAELTARRKESGASETGRVSPELLVQIAAAVGIPESDVRRSLVDLKSAKAIEPDSLAKKLYGPALIRAVREIERAPETAQSDLEGILRLKHGLKLRNKTEASSQWDAGDVLGTMRRTMDFSDHRVLFKVQSIELRVREASETRSQAYLTADFSNQRSEYLSLGGILGATLAVPAAIAGVYNPLYFLLIPPMLAVPGLGFKLAYNRACAQIRQALDLVLDAAERVPTPPEPQEPQPEVSRRIRDLNPIPRFTTRSKVEE
ncbi:MAG: hypothetical protein ACFB50_07610 [Rubrobacteraceae bacterium]